MCPLPHSVRGVGRGRVTRLTLCQRVLDVAGRRTLHPSIRRAADDVRANADLLDAATDVADVEGDPPVPGVRDAMFALRGTLAWFAVALRAFGEMPVDDASTCASPTASRSTRASPPG
jgi:hypothetical protein